VNNEIEYTYDDAINSHQHYEKVVTLYCVEGWDVTILWEGVLVKDLITEAGVDPTAKVVIFYAYDGYSTSLPLEYIIDNDIIMAHKMNGVILPPERGFPFQLVAESKYGYKWIKWITRIELSDDVKKIIDWSLFVVTVVYLLTGLGITQYRIIEPITFGLLKKSLSFKIHENLLILFLTLLSLHILFGPIAWVYFRLKKKV